MFVIFVGVSDSALSYCNCVVTFVVLLLCPLGRSRWKWDWSCVVWHGPWTEQPM